MIICWYNNVIAILYLIVTVHNNPLCYGYILDAALLLLEVVRLAITQKENASKKCETNKSFNISYIRFTYMHTLLVKTSKSENRTNTIVNHGYAWNSQHCICWSVGMGTYMNTTKRL